MTLEPLVTMTGHDVGRSDAKPEASACTSHLTATVRAITDLARMLEAVRLQSGLGNSQWERVKRARQVAVDADQFLAMQSKEAR